MYFHTSPNDLYNEYQARVAAAVRNRAFDVELAEYRPLEQPVKVPARSGLHAWWTHFCFRFVRMIAPAEEGSIA